MSRKLRMHELGRLSQEEFIEAPKRQVVVVLDNVRSLHNVGSIFRTADAFRLEAIYLCGLTPLPPHPEIEKTALGATLSVSWHHFDSTQDALTHLEHKQYEVYALEQATRSTPLHTFQSTKPLALVLGHEVKGVDQAVVDRCKACIEIPQDGTKHSLNVSVSAGIALWHLSQLHPL